jgi:hypothetical protein
MNNKTLIIILWISLIGIIAGMIVMEFETPGTLSIKDGMALITLVQKLSSILINFFTSIFLLTGTYLLLKNGTFIRSREYRFLGLAIAFSILGIMFNIMHWQFGAQLLLIGFISIFLLYTIHFIKKPVKRWMDWGKWLFVFLFLLGKIISGNHWEFGPEIITVSFLLLVILLFRYINETGLMKKPS